MPYCEYMSRSLVTLDAMPSLSVFLAVVENGSFARAARQAGLTTSSVSKRIADLERRLGVQLLHRTTRRLALTDAGTRLRGHAERILRGLEVAESELLDLAKSPRGLLRIATSVSFGQLYLGALASEFAKQHPDVRIEMSLDDAFVDLVAGGFDLAIRCGRMPDSSFVVRKLAPSRRLVCAAPAYLARRGVPKHPRELTAHDCLRHLRDEDATTWTFQERGEPLRIRVSGPVDANNLLVLREAAASGAGIALLPSFVVADHVRDGRLRVLLEDFTVDKGFVYALHPPGRQPSRVVNAFVSHLADRLPALVTPS